MDRKEWKETYNSEDNSQLRKLQGVLLGNFRAFASICEKYHLRYFMIGGTMLGAVRHKGFIPWDDDIDFGMPREDYEKLLLVAPAEMPQGYAFLNYKTDEDYHRYFSRVVDTGVTIYNRSNSERIAEKAWLDIFPFDGMPKGKLHQKIHFYYLTFWRFLFHASCFSELVNLGRPDRPKYQLLSIKFLQKTHFGSRLDTKKIALRIEKRLCRYPFDTSEMAVIFFGANVSREVIPRCWIGEMPFYEFEEEMIPGVQEYDKYLKYLYDDYMQVPKDVDKDKHNIEYIEYAEP